MADQRDLELRRAALEQVRELQRRYDDLIPLSALSEGFVFAGRRISFGSFFSGIFRPKEMNGPAALCVVTAPPKENRPYSISRTSAGPPARERQRAKSGNL